jgi:hypothetical protein
MASPPKTRAVAGVVVMPWPKRPDGRLSEQERDAIDNLFAAIVEAHRGRAAPAAAWLREDAPGGVVPVPAPDRAWLRRQIADHHTVAMRWPEKRRASHPPDRDRSAERTGRGTGPNEDHEAADASEIPWFFCRQPTRERRGNLFLGGQLITAFQKHEGPPSSEERASIDAVVRHLIEAHAREPLALVNGMDRRSRRAIDAACRSKPL